MRKKNYSLIICLIIGAVVGYAIAQFLPIKKSSDSYSQTAAGFGIEVGPIELDFGSRDYYNNCYYGSDGYYYCDYYYYNRPYYGPGPYYYYDSYPRHRYHHRHHGRKRHHRHH